jgi:hypothetical protein
MAGRRSPRAAAAVVSAGAADVAAVADGVVDVAGVAVPLERVWVQVVVAHDGLLPGAVHEMAYTVRTSNLIASGYLELHLPPDGVL